MSLFPAKKYLPLATTVISGVLPPLAPVGSNTPQCTNNNGNVITNPYIVDILYPNDHFYIVNYAIIPDLTDVGINWVTLPASGLPNSVSYYFGTASPVPATPVAFGGLQIGEILEPVVGLNNLVYYTNSKFYIYRVEDPITLIYSYYGVFQSFLSNPLITTNPMLPFFYYKGDQNPPGQTPTFLNTINQSTKLIIVSDLISGTPALLTKTSTSVVLKNKHYSNNLNLSHNVLGVTNPITFSILSNSVLQLYGTVKTKRIFALVYSMALNLSFVNGNPVLQSPNISLNQILFSFVSATDIVSGQSAPDNYLPSGLRFNFSALTNNSPAGTANMRANYLVAGSETADFLNAISLSKETTVHTLQVNSQNAISESTTYTTPIDYNPIISAYTFETTLTYTPYLYDSIQSGTWDNILTITMHVEYYPEDVLTMV